MEGLIQRHCDMDISEAHYLLPGPVDAAAILTVSVTANFAF